MLKTLFYDVLNLSIVGWILGVFVLAVRARFGRSTKKTSFTTEIITLFVAVSVILGCVTDTIAYAKITTDRYGNYTLKSFSNMHQINWEKLSEVKSQINWKIDLDNDKTNEKINIFQKLNKNNDSKSVLRLTVNNSSVNIQPYDREIVGAAVLDINKNDKFKEIAIYTYFSSDDNEVLFYRYSNKKIISLGALPLVTDIVPGEVQGLYINNDNILSSPQRVGIFESHAQRKYYKFNSKASKFYELKQPFDYLQGNTIKASKVISMKSSLKANKYDITVQKGEKLKVIGTYKEKWVLLKKMNGKECWFNLGEAKEWYNMFEGLILYD